MHEIVLLIHILINGAYVYYAYRRFGAEEKELLYVIGKPIGIRIGEEQICKMVSASCQEKLGKLYSGQGYKEGLVRYQYGRIGLLYLILMVGVFLAIAFDQTYIAGQPMGYLIERPLFGEGDQSYFVHYSIDDEDKVTGQMPVLVKERIPDEKIAMDILREYEPLLQDMVLGDNISRESVTRDLILNESPFSEAIVVTYESLSRDYMTDKGQLRTNLMTYDTPYDLQMKVRMIFGEAEFIQVYDFTAYRSLPSAIQESTGIADRVVVEEDYVILPEMTELGKKPIRWQSMEEGLSGGQVLLLSIMVGIAFYILKEKDLNRAILKRQEEILYDFPGVVNKLTILIGAGMTFNRAWQKIVTDYQNKSKVRRVLYEEMVKVSKDLQMGVPEAEAIDAFGKRCRSIEVVRLSSILVQNLRRGSHSLTTALKTLSYEAWEIRTSNARKLGEKASTKLLIPMAISLLTVLLVVIAPTFMKMQI